MCMVLTYEVPVKSCGVYLNLHSSWKTYCIKCFVNLKIMSLLSKKDIYYNDCKSCQEAYFWESKASLKSQSHGYMRSV